MIPDTEIYDVDFLGQGEIYVINSVYIYKEIALYTVIMCQ